MTLVAAYKRYGVPLLISDVLITKEGPTGKHFDLATLRDVNEALPSDKRLTVLPPAQKSYIISNTLCLGWCGNFGAATIAIPRIVDGLGSAQPTEKELGEFLKATRPELEKFWKTHSISSDRGRLVLVGWLIDRGVPKAFRWDTADWSLHTDPNRALCGTGQTTFTRYFLDPVFSANYRPSPSAEPAEPAIMDALYDIAQLLTLERRNVRLRFGGGFQISYFGNGGFHHVDNYIALTSRGTVLEGRSSDITFSDPYVAFKYIDGWFVVRNFALKPMQMVNELEGSAEIKHILPNVARSVFVSRREPDSDTFRNLPILPRYYILPFLWQWPDGHASMSGNVFQSSGAADRKYPHRTRRRKDAR